MLSGAVRDQVMSRARNRCEYCLIDDSLQVATFHIDHCVPRSRGGTYDFDNLSWACPSCNGSKLGATEGKDPATGDTAPLFNPRRHSWNEHFGWNDERTQILGLTPTGRATIEGLLFNRPKMIRIRQKLRALGLFDPTAE